MDQGRRDFVKFLAAGAAAVPFLTARDILASQGIELPEKQPEKPHSILLEAKNWSELPALLARYEKMIDAEQGGVSRIFGYASIIKDHTNEKPAGSKDIPNENATLRGMEVAMNVLAAGEFEFRGTRGKYTDKEGKQKRFANIGVYAGLEPAENAEGYAKGKNITVSKADRRESLKAYIKRELGDLPAGIAPDDLFDSSAAAKFEALKGTDADKFGMYKFQVANLEVAGGRQVPAVTVSTNDESMFAAIGLSAMQTANLILDGQGYVRDGGKRGGSALDYFKKNVMAVTRENGLNQPRLEAIDAAVEELAGVYAEINAVSKQKLPPKEEYEAFKKILDAHPAIAGEQGKKPFMRQGSPIAGIFSPYFYDGQNVNKRAPVTGADLELPENKDMPHTAGEKLDRIERLKRDGKTDRTR